MGVSPVSQALLREGQSRLCSCRKTNTKPHFGCHPNACVNHLALKRHSCGEDGFIWHTYQPLDIVFDQHYCHLLKQEDFNSDQAVRFRILVPTSSKHLGGFCGLWVSPCVPSHASAMRLSQALRSVQHAPCRDEHQTCRVMGKLGDLGPSATSKMSLKITDSGDARRLPAPEASDSSYGCRQLCELAC
jgi:hypothetical protein